jgi:hypothetical protein
MDWALKLLVAADAVAAVEQRLGRGMMDIYFEFAVLVEEYTSVGKGLSEVQVDDCCIPQ